MEDNQLRESLQERLALAMERLKNAEAEVERWKRHIQALREVLATFLNESPQFVMLPDLHFPAKNSLARMTIKEAARTVLEKHGQPMRVRDLLGVLNASGRKVGGKKPTDTLRSVLRFYEDVFARTPDARWTVANGVPDEKEENALSER